MIKITTKTGEEIVGEEAIKKWAATDPDALKLIGEEEARISTELFHLRVRTAHLRSTMKALELLDSPDGRLTPELALRLRDHLIEGALSTETLDARVVNAAKQAAVVVWGADMWRAAQRGHEVFAGTPAQFSGGLAGPLPQFWFFDPWPAFSNTEGEESLFIGLAVLPTSERSVVCGTVRIFPGDDSGSGFKLSFPETLEEGQPVSEGLASVTAGMCFMQQEYVGQERQVLPRYLRRQAELKRRPPLPEISVVQLRRPYREAKAGAGESEAREWSCQWIVGAHWRRQWMPSKATWEPRYIRPYLKGDPSKPLHEPKGTVYVVNR